MKSDMRLSEGLCFIIIILFFSITLYVIDVSVFEEHNIVEIWIFTGIISLPIFFHTILAERDSQMYSNIFCKYYDGVLKGTWLGLGLKSILIVNIWYKDSDNGIWEPLFIMLTLATASVMFSNKVLTKSCTK